MAKQNAIANSVNACVVAEIVCANRYGVSITLEGIYARANKHKLKAKCVETITTYEKLKSDGGKRIIHDFGPVRRVRSIIASDIFFISAPMNKWEYCKTGKNAKCIFQGVEEALEQEYLFWAVLDIKDAFPSVRRGHIFDMVDMSKLVVQELIPYIGYGTSANKEAVQPALPQGMAASSLVLSALVGQALCKLPKQIARCCFVDDLLVGAKSQTELDASTEALKGYFANLSAGPLTLTVVETCDFSSNSEAAIRFIGYKARLDKFTKEFRISPNARSFGRMKKEVVRRATKMITDDFHYSLMEKLILSYARNWAQQFHLWPKTSQSITLYEITAITALSETWSGHLNAKSSS
ncbi:reverse transcriptase domain-containing protein [Hellea sp.]|nr:reverse transcriptase domain-containing protein [Hellea sp.]